MLLFFFTGNLIFWLPVTLIAGHNTRQHSNNTVSKTVRRNITFVARFQRVFDKLSSYVQCGRLCTFFTNYWFLNLWNYWNLKYCVFQFSSFSSTETIRQNKKIKKHSESPYLLTIFIFKQFNKNSNMYLFFHWKCNPFAPCHPCCW